MKTIENRAWEIKKELSQRVKHQLRRIPVLHFYRDDTLDYVFKMEEIFKNIAAQEKSQESSGEESNDNSTPS
jgi:ribosome-binding factor A